MPSKRTHCIGLIVVDALSYPLKQYPIPRQLTQVNTENLRFATGGGAANTAAALAQMGLSASVFSKVGNDFSGRFALDFLNALGVGVQDVRVSSEEATPFTYVGVHPEGERTFVHTPGTNLTISADDFDRESLLHCDFFFYQDCWCLPRLDGLPGAELLAAARSNGAVTLLDECWGLGPNRQTWESMLPHADYVLPSFDDMQAIYPGTRPEEVIRFLQNNGARHVVLKMGKQGCLVATNDGRVTHVESEARKIIDPTGAGDCFDAGFIAGLAEGMAPPLAARLGSLTAAACIANMGAAAGIPPLRELLNKVTA